MSFMALRTIYLMVGLCSSFIAYTVKLNYRAYVIENDIVPGLLANNGPSFFYGIGIIFILIAVNKDQGYKRAISICIWASVGSGIYEISQSFSNMTFDLLDLIAIVVAAVTSIGVITMVHKLNIASNTTIVQ